MKSYAELKKDIQHKMEVSLEHAKKEFSGLRTGRASTSLLENVTVEAYGARMPLNQCASVSVPEPRLLSVSVWDKGLAKAVEKGIREANLGLNPMADGTLIRVPIPPLTAERRTELTKVAHKYAENARVAIRNVRRDGNKAADTAFNDRAITEDQLDEVKEQIQTLTKTYEGKVKELVDKKSAELME